MNRFLPLALLAGVLALSACTTVQQAPPRTSSTTTEETIVHHPAPVATTQTQVTSY